MTERITLVITTIGRAGAIEKLLASVADQLLNGDRLVVVAQGHTDEISASVQQWNSRSEGRIDLVTSQLGASLGRNTGATHAAQDAQDGLLMFPNDTTTFPDGSLAAIRRDFASRSVGAVRVMTASGARFDLPPEGSPLDHRSVWSVIEMGLVIRHDQFHSVGGFDERIGTGATTPWQAGEVTDLLLRLQESNPAIGNSFFWAHSADAYVLGVQETQGLSGRERRRKLRAYGRGVGYIYRRHPFPHWQRWAFVVAGLTIGLRRAEDYTVWDGVTAFIGRLEGVLGRTWGRPHSLSAVVR